MQNHFTSFQMYSFVETFTDKCQKELLIKDQVTYKLLLNNTPFSAFTDMLKACNSYIMDAIHITHIAGL